MKKSYSQSHRGQSAVEFILAAPLLLVIFFGIIQLAYMGLVALAAQRAALSLAQESSLTGNPTGPSLAFDLGYALAPLAALHPATLAAITGARCVCERSLDQKKITARVSCPIPIWVPVIGKIFGEKLSSLGKGDFSSILRGIQAAFALFNIPAPNISSIHLPSPYVWIAHFEASVYNEGYSRTP